MAYNLVLSLLFSSFEFLLQKKMEMKKDFILRNVRSITKLKKFQDFFFPFIYIQSSLQFDILVYNDYVFGLLAQDWN